MTGAPRHLHDALPRHGAVVALRRLSGDDLPAFQAYRSDAGVGRYQGWSPMSDAGALAFLSEMAAIPLFEPGMWAQIGIAESRSQRLVGDIGLFLAEDGRHAEIGFTLARDAQGRGMATAAVRAAIELVFDGTAVERVLGITDARNAASVRLLERVGMRKVESKSAVFRDEPCVDHVSAIARADRPRERST